MDQRSDRGASAYLTEHPEGANYTDSVATARLESGLQVRVTGPRRALETDMPGAVGGAASRPGPAGTFGQPWRPASPRWPRCVPRSSGSRLRCEVDVDSESDDRGILGLEPSVPAGPLRCASGSGCTRRGVGLERLEDIAVWAVEHCPASDAIRRAVPVHIEVTAE